MMSNKIFAVIPARSGSKSIKNKNIQLLDEMPLLAHSITVAQSVPQIDMIIVSTDSIQYAEIAANYGARFVLRPEEISRDNSTDIEWVQHVLMNCSKKPLYLVHLRPTSPLRSPAIVSRAIKFIKKHPKCSAVRSVVKMSETAYKQFEIDTYLKAVGSGDFNLDNANKPRQSYPTTYTANGYVDILKVSYILANHKIHGDRVLPFFVPPITDIDTMEDLEYARYQTQLS